MGGLHLFDKQMEFGHVVAQKFGRPVVADLAVAVIRPGVNWM
jgi:hypothetical protein